MADFTRGQLRRRRERLEQRLAFLRHRIETRNLRSNSHDVAEASAIETALVLFDEELRRSRQQTRREVCDG